MDTRQPNSNSKLIQAKSPHFSFGFVILSSFGIRHSSFLLSFKNLADLLVGAQRLAVAGRAGVFAFEGTATFVRFDTEPLPL
jgi:hypothetical protein